ncbi:MAG TPA: shikimate dehydrogenase [Beijerinckiaceae bacterium]|jgi:shikimate dehydrogenase
MSRPQRYLLAGVMGSPIMHSRSPAIHNHWLAERGLLGRYVPLAVTPDGLEKALRALHPLGFSGVNLTIPLKEMALPLLDEVDPVARAIGAVNCVVVGEDGRLRGYNYDAFGYVESLREAAPAWRAGAGPAVVLGAGGASRALIAGLLDEGAPQIRLANRTLERAQALAAEFGPRVVPVRWEERSEALAGAALLVNATSMGMKGQPPLEIALDPLPSGALVSDIVYAPLETELLAAARARGHVAVDGLGMLLHQARPAFEKWFGVRPDVTPRLRAEIEATL